MVVITVSDGLDKSEKTVIRCNEMQIKNCRKCRKLKQCGVKLLDGGKKEGKE
jgi:hypothetical protein